MSTILIVEDNEKNMKLVRDLMQFKGHTTIEAVTGNEGIRQALANHPDLILMDIQLPDVNGIEALRQIRADPAMTSIPIIAVTASVMPGDRQKIESAGFDAYLTKPIELRPFLATVDHFLANGRAV
jgi:two-component system, cell cycle response regulator DivK